MRASHLVGLSLFIAPIACGDDENGTPTPSEPGLINGQWASLRVSSQCFDGPLGSDRVLFTWLSRHSILQNETSNRITTEICNVTLTPYRGSSSTYPAAAVEGFDVDNVFIEDGRAEGASFSFGPQTILLGWTPSGNPVSEPLPTEDTDPRLVDADDDGNPGATLGISGLIEGNVYIANRNVVRATGTVVSADRITGTTTTEASQRIVGADNIFLINNSTVVTDDPNANSSPFEMIRLASNVTCEEITAQLFTLTSTGTPTDCPIDSGD
ncbi:MAG: hypothetical protein AAF449_22825 [Myxococcota bacterium]